MKTIKVTVDQIFEQDYLLTNSGIFRVIDFENDTTVWLHNETVAQPDNNGFYTRITDPEFLSLLNKCREKATQIALDEDFNGYVEETIFQAQCNILCKAFFLFYDHIGLV
jgi:hypothetical protein